MPRQQSNAPSARWPPTPPLQETLVVAPLKTRLRVDPAQLHSPVKPIMGKFSGSGAPQWDSMGGHRSLGSQQTSLCFWEGTGGRVGKGLLRDGARAGHRREGCAGRTHSPNLAE